MSRILAGCLILATAGAAAGQVKNEPLAVQVKNSIARGVANLVSKDTWEISDVPYKGGSTALVVLALLNCDHVLDDPRLEQQRKDAVERGLKYLRSLDADTVYVRALQTMALAEAGRKQDLPLIEKNVDWLLKARVYQGSEFVGWGYHQGKLGTDASNSQYAMLALWYARQAGVKRIDRDVWKQIRDYYVRSQSDKGFWVYSKDYKDFEMNQPSKTMTIAGLCGLLIAGMELNDGREIWQPGGRFKNCGVYPDDAAVANALRWINDNFDLKLDEQRTGYHLYGLERAGRLSGLRFFGEHDWYREGCETLVKRQRPLDGAWPIHPAWDRYPYTNTAFALLFLSKGRTPVAISKLVHGAWKPPQGRVPTDTDWNNDRNDLRHLTEYLSRKENNPYPGTPPLAWQTYDISLALEARAGGRAEPGANDVNDAEAVVADMLQSPILYITGHEQPQLRISPNETRLIRRYLDNGGLVFAEACCGSQAFDAGIKEWVAKLYDNEVELRKLDSTHPVWTCFNKIKPGDPYELWSVQAGCRTVLIYSPQDLSCFWESNRLDDGPTRRAFELGANIVKYATGDSPPLPRLTPIQLTVGEKPKDDPQQRGYFQVGQVSYGGANWKPAPKAMSNLMMHVREATGINVRYEERKIELREPGDVFGNKFFYMHGRDPFTLGDELANFRATLENGGLLLADACCGKEAFDKSFRAFVQQLFPKQKLEVVPPQDSLYSAKLNGEEISDKNIRCRIKANAPMQAMAPYLEGIRVKGRWVVLYSKYDIGCALEKHTSPDCVGYDPASALRLATAAVLYNSKP